MPCDSSRALTLQTTVLRPALALATSAWIFALVTTLAAAAAVLGEATSDRDIATGSPAEPHGDPRRDALDTLLRSRAQTGFRGVVLVSEGSETLLHEGYGTIDGEGSGVMPRDAVFTLGSIAKPFTAILVLQLEEEGHLRVDDPISRHLPGVPEDKRAITLHHLLTHSSGLPAALGKDFDFVDRDTLVTLAMGAPLHSEPGERYEYSNVGYSLLAAIVEHRTGLSYAEALRRRILGPAGMTETGFDPALWPAERLARGHRDGEPWGTVVERFGPRGPSWHLVGNGGLHSTATDMLKFHRALEDDRLSSAVAKAKAFAPHIAEDEAGTSHYGYGWTLYDTARGGRLLAHNGGNRIFFADFQRYVDDDRMVFLAAAQPMRGLGRLAEEIAQRLATPESTPEAASPRVSLLIGAPEPHGGPTDDRLDTSTLGRATSRFLAALRAPASERQTDGLFSQRLLEKLGAEGPRTVLDRLAEDLGDFTLDSAERVGDDRVEMVTSSEEPFRLLLILHFELGESPTIRGIEVEGLD